MTGSRFSADLQSGRRIAPGGGETNQQRGAVRTNELQRMMGVRRADLRSAGKTSSAHVAVKCHCSNQRMFLPGLQLESAQGSAGRAGGCRQTIHFTELLNTQTENGSLLPNMETDQTSAVTRCHQRKHQKIFHDKKLSVGHRVHGLVRLMLQLVHYLLIT